MILQRLKRRIRADEAGFTLTEALAALIILGVAVAAIVTAMGTSIVASDVHRKSVTADAVVRSYAEQIESSKDWTNCMTPTYLQYQPAAFAQLTIPAGYHAAISSVDYWNGDSPATFDGSCPDNGLVRITVQAWWGDPAKKLDLQQIQIVKRNPT